MYNAQIVAGSLLLTETRRITRLKDQLDGQGEEAWHQAVVVENVLQKKSPASALRQARLIRNRLKEAPDCLLSLLSEGSQDMAVQACMAVVIKHSNLLADFMDHVVREHHRCFEPDLNKQDWVRFLENCGAYAPEVTAWSESTRIKLGQVVFRTLAEAGYIDNTRSMRLKKVVILPEIQSCMESCGDNKTLRCMLVNS